ncbi:MAG: autotransporter-associated beta strand repeat-containing protein, partial [Phenylobacterium sp.]
MATFIVSNIGDSGAGSLREAIVAANSNPGPDQIGILTAPSQSFTPLAPLPELTEDVTFADGALIINGVLAIGTSVVTFGTVTNVQGLTGLGTASVTTSLTIEGSASSTFGGVIAGAGSLTKSGVGTLTLSGTNTFAGDLAVQAGAVTLSGGAALADQSGVTVSAGATLNIATTENIGSIAGSGTISLAAGTVLRTGYDYASTTFSGAIDGAGSLVKAGTGTLTLSSFGTYQGGTEVNSGTLSIASDANLGSGTVTLANGATLAVTGATTIDNAITLSGAATYDGAAAQTLSGVISG